MVGHVKNPIKIKFHKELIEDWPDQKFLYHIKRIIKYKM